MIAVLPKFICGLGVVAGGIAIAYGVFFLGSSDMSRDQAVKGGILCGAGALMVLGGFSALLYKGQQQ